MELRVRKIGQEIVLHSQDRCAGLFMNNEGRNNALAKRYFKKFSNLRDFDEIKCAAECGLVVVVNWDRTVHSRNRDGRVLESCG